MSTKKGAIASKLAASSTGESKKVVRGKDRSNEANYKNVIFTYRTLKLPISRIFVLVMMATVVMTLVKRQMVAANQQVTVANQLVTVAKVQVINGEGADDDWRCCKGVGVVLWWLVASFDLRGLGPYM